MLGRFLPCGPVALLSPSNYRPKTNNSGGRRQIGPHVSLTACLHFPVDTIDRARFGSLTTRLLLLAITDVWGPVGRSFFTGSRRAARKSGKFVRD